jgi:ABC-2 type transport system ATP-binding protein
LSPEAVLAPSPAGEAVIRAQSVGRRFGRVAALSNVSLEVGRGEIVGLVGPDGSGKTTLLQILAAILDPTEGRCHVLGFDTVRQSSAVTSRIGYMSQGFTLYPRLTVAENLSFAAKIRNVDETKFAERALRLLAMAGLERFESRLERDLSGGMRKKLALCTNLIHEPALLLLDEPSLGVDPVSRRELWGILRAFRSRGVTIVFSTSYMDEADLCDRVGMLDAGRLIAWGNPAQLREQARGRVYELRTAQPLLAERALSADASVVGVQWRAGRIRFQASSSASQANSARSVLPDDITITPASPTMEDVFVLQAGEAKPERQAADAGGPPFSGVMSGNWDGSIRTDSLTRRFGRFIAVDSVSLDIHAGEIFGFLGPNGAGKTTVIKMLTGLLRPSDGAATVAGIDVAQRSHEVRKRIGYMSQRFSLYPDLSVDESLDCFARAYGLRREAARETIAWVKSKIGLHALAEKRVVSLSGAERQRLALATSLLHRPSVLFLDEPTSGVDPLSRYRFWRLVKELATAGTTVVVTTHYLEEATYCDRLGLMYDGKLIAAGALEALLRTLPLGAPQTVEEVFMTHITRAREGART